MIYNQLEKKDTQYEGSSYSSQLSRGFAWSAEDTGYFELLDPDGAVVSTGPTTISLDSNTFDFHVPDDATTGLDGKYRLLIHLTNSNDETVDITIADYTIIYKIRKA